MNCQTALARLKAAGSAQTRKTYGRHGVRGEMFGVSYAHLGRLHKEIKTDHALACALWASGNHDARVLATMIADPALVDNALAEAWVKDLDNAIDSDAFSGVLRKSKLAQRKAAKWTKSKHEWIGRAGWNIVAGLALYEPSLPDDYFTAFQSEIERTIHARPNRTRDAMNNALIAIGVRSPQLRKLALSAANRIGKVEVDHGDTSCKTPDAALYIQKTLAHRKQMQAKRRAKATGRK
ncbi:MAG: DNA alkylation repair protein [Pirellulales bacterium]